MNELQLKEFEILKIFVEICDKLNLNYFLVRGTALGAVKYNGFIPWDDDIDVALPRQDYEKFLSMATKLLPKEIFLQSYRTDPQFPFPYAKLRNCNTTYIEKNVRHLKINHGVFIDIFPIDGYPKEKRAQFALKNKKKFLSWQYFCALCDENEPFKVRFRNKIFRALGFAKRTSKSLEKFDKAVSKYPLEIYAEHPNDFFVDGATQAEFEGLKVKIPKNYELYLTYKYGDWRADLPEDKKKGHHYFTVYDLEKSFTEYIIKI